jgi:predicted O-methyltransferase YrrM
MGLERNIQIKNYIHSLFVEEDAELRKVKIDSSKESVPDIHVPAHVGKLISLITRIRNPQRVLEIGTLVGYSTSWIASALSDTAHMITLEKVPRHVELAQQNLLRLGLKDKVTFRVGIATELLQEMIQKKEKPFDLIFIDADKQNYPTYLQLCLQLSHKGTVILSDNLIPKDNAIGKANENDADAKGIYTFNQQIASHPNLTSIIATTIVGEKGRVDGLGISIVKI